MQRIQCALMVLLFSTCSITASSQQTASSTTVPRLVRFSGTIKDVSGKQVTGVAGVTFALYKDQEGGATLWLETQNAQLDAAGHYTVMLGATKSDGLPTELFTSGEARWLGVQPAGQAEQPRVLLLSVPYALKAGDAETVGGLPPSAFLRATPEQGAATASSSAGNLAPALQPIVHGNGTLNFVPLWTGKSLIGSSILIQSGSKLGIGIDAPATTLDVNGAATIRGNETVNGTLNTTGTLTGQSGSFTANNGASILSVFQQGNGAAVFAGFNTGIGIDSFSLATSGNTVGVQGIVASLTGTGVLGQGATGVKGSGLNVGGLFNLSGNSGLILQGTNKSGQTQFSVDGGGNLFANGSLVTNGSLGTFGQLTAGGNARTAIIGDPGCGFGYAGIGFGALSGCTNYSMIGNSKDTFLNRPAGGYLHFRENNGGSNGAGDQVLIAPGGAVGIGTSSPNAMLDVRGSSGNPGFGIAADNNVWQARGAGGWVKAMAYVDPFASGGIAVTRCYNTQAGGAAVSTPPCGITLSHQGQGDNVIDFGFEVDDRFISLTVFGDQAIAVGSVGFNGNQQRVVTYLSDIHNQTVDVAFSVFVY
jgi:hypothetical protein